MPAFMRVNPVITWTYGQIWQFINTHHIPVCRLYQEGYTSLGKVDNTAKNPALRQADGSYLPAWQLSDWSLERAGRLAPAQSPGTGSPGRRSMAQVESRLKAATNVGLVVIGDEVLQGKVQEENSNYAISALRARGMPIHRCVGLPPYAPQPVCSCCCLCCCCCCACMLLSPAADKRPTSTAYKLSRRFMTKQDRICA